MMKKIFSVCVMILIQAGSLLAMGQQPVTGGSGTPAPQGSSLNSLLIFFLPLLLIWYFLLIRPQQKKEKQKKAMLNELQKGDKIMTIGGIFGEVVMVKDNRITIKIADKTNVEVSKTAISGKVT